MLETGQAKAPRAAAPRPRASPLEPDAVANAAASEAPAPATAIPPLQYEKRLARAKQAKHAAQDGSASTRTGFSINLSSLEKSLPESASVAQGEHDVKDPAQMTTPRAQTEVAITQRGEPKHRHSQMFKLGPETLGRGRFKFAWRPGGEMIATAGVQGGELVVQLFLRSGSAHLVHRLPGDSCLWLGWDSKGTTLGFLQEGKGIFLWDMPSDGSGNVGNVPISLCPMQTIGASFCKWSKVSSHLAIGTHEGKVIIFNKGQSVLTMHEKKGKHGMPVTCAEGPRPHRPSSPPPHLLCTALAPLFTSSALPSHPSPHPSSLPSLRLDSLPSGASISVSASRSPQVR